MAAVLAAAALFGTTGTAQALGPDAATPLGVGAARLLVGGLALLAVLPLLGVPVRAALGLWRTPAGLLALVVLGERPGRSWVAATALCVAGLALLGGDLPAGADPVGVLLAVVAGLGYAAYTVLAKRVLRTGTASSTVMAAAFGLGGLLLVPVLVAAPTAWLGTPGGIALVLWLGLATTTLGYVLFGRGLAVLPAGPVTTLVLAEPLVATALGVGLLEESLDAAGVAGAALVLAGLVLQGAAAGRSRAPVPVPTT